MPAKPQYSDAPLVGSSLQVNQFDFSKTNVNLAAAYSTPLLVDPKCTYAFHYYENAWSSVRNNITEIKALNPQTGQTSYSLQTSSGSFFGIDEKGGIVLNARSNPDTDPTAGQVSLLSQGATRFEVGRQFAIHVNKSGKHQEDATGSNSNTQKQNEASYPAFSIQVDNGGINITCENGNIAFLGKNITLSASETISLSANKSISILAAFNPGLAAASGIAQALGAPPLGGGGQVTIKAGKFINNSASIEQTASTTTKQTSGSANFNYVASSNGIQSINAPGDLAINASGNLDINAGQKMRIQAQNLPVNPTGLSVPSVWAVTQKAPLAIISNQGAPPLPTGIPAIDIVGWNGDVSAKVEGTGNIGISALTGNVGISAGVKLPKPGEGTTDVTINATKDVTIDAVASVNITGTLDATIGSGSKGKATTFYKASNAEGLNITSPNKMDVKAALATMTFSGLDIKGGGQIQLNAAAILLN
jgi:hypothetical protein